MLFAVIIDTNSLSLPEHAIDMLVTKSLYKSSVVGLVVGIDGMLVGVVVGILVGIEDGTLVGVLDGKLLGFLDGVLVGWLVGVDKISIK